MPVFPEDLTQMEYFNYLRSESLITDDEFNELNDLNERIKAGLISVDYCWSNRLNELKELFLKKRNNSVTNNEFNVRKMEILNLNNEDILSYELSTIKEESNEAYKPSYLNGTVFDAVLTNNHNLNSDIKRKILFANTERYDFEYIPFQFLLDSFRILHNFFPETFIKNKGVFIDTGEIINDDSDCTSLFHYNFTAKDLFESYISGTDDGPVNIFSKPEIIEKKMLADIIYKDSNFDKYYLLDNEDIKTSKIANYYMSSYYKENLLYENKIIRIETEKLIRVNIGDLFWVLPKHGIHYMAIGKIINVVKSRKLVDESAV
jgi:hypothetical protein